jgi:FO synthase subunit 1
LSQDELELEYTFPESKIEEILNVETSDVPDYSTLSFAKNVFLPLTTACRYTCSYCTYFDVPGQAELMSPQELRSVMRAGYREGCSEALFTFGDKPDDRYEAIHDQLAEYGHDSILEYLYEACEMALEVGLLPHSNPGDLTADEMARLKEVNASMGVMLETTADVDAHSGPRVKSPRQRLKTLENAGRLNVPFTSGLLIGIGESWAARAHSLLCLKRLHEEYGHLQEIIIQNVVPNERSDFERPETKTMRKVVAMARYTLPEDVHVQVPPNLSPVEELLDCGISDLGGISPVTDDYINPDFEWPALKELQRLADKHGLELTERGPLYDRYKSDDRWISDRISNQLSSNGSANPSIKTGGVN